MILRWLPVIAATGVLVLGGVIHGLTTNRWGQSDAVARAVAQLENVPMAIGDWQGQAQEGLNPRETERAEIKGYLSRVYVNQRTNQRVRLLLACGRPGPIAVHTPDICFQGAGFAALSAPTRYPSRPLAGIPAEFFMSKFGKEGPAGAAYLRVCWTWNAGGGWLAPTNPRWQFGGEQALYKLYLIQELPVHDDDTADDACLRFIPELIPALDRALFKVS